MECGLANGAKFHSTPSFCFKMDFQLGEPEESGIQSLVSAALDTSQYNFNSLPYTELDRRHSMVNLERRHSLVDYKDNNVLDLQPKNKSTKYYALRIASIPGIYKSWDYCSTLINGCPGAKYKSFYSLQESIDYIRQQFPEAEFKQEGENWLLVDNSPVFKIIEEARSKKEKIMGVLIKNDCSSLEKTDPDYEALKGLINSKSNLQVTLNREQLEILHQVKKGLNLLISAGRETGKNVLLDHIYSYLAKEKKTFHVTTTSIVTALDENINYTLGWTGMGKALGTLKNMLAKVRKNTSARKAWADCDVIIIKDCSLLSSFLIEVMDYLGKQIRKSTEPFGGIQIILIGDLFGVKPQNTNSICCPNCGQTHKLSQANFETGTESSGYMTCCNPQCGSVFRNSWIQYAFESACWTDSKFQYYELRKSYCADSQLRELVTAVSRQDIDTISELTSDCIIADESLMKNVPTLCTTTEEANSINDQKFQELKSFDSIKFDAIDVVLNNFDFTARAEQKEGPTEETLELKIGAQVLVMSSNERTMEHGVLMSMVKPSELEKQDMIKRCGMGYPQYEKSVNDWLSKNPLIPRVKMTTGGEIRNIGCWLYAIHTSRRVVAWRVHVPIRLAYAVPVYKCHRMKLENLYVSFYN